MEFVIGKRFKIGKKIGAGGFGEVYEAIDLKTKSVVALKMERRTAGVPVLNYEASIMRQLEGIPNIPQLLKVGTDGDFNFMAMDYIGCSLEHAFVFCERKFSLAVSCKIVNKN
jgi:serine/threonine protein kinase